MRLTFRRVLFLVSLSLLIGGCKKQISDGESATNPVAIFNELWNTLDQRYALFSIKNVDWDEIYREYSGRVTDNMSERELFNALNTMLQNLKDGHVALLSPFDTAVYTRFYSAFPRNFNYNNIVNNYLNNDFKTIGPVILKITDQVAYIYYSSFAREISIEELNTIFAEVKVARGLIIDVRNNTGGNTNNAARLVKFLASEKRLVKYELIKKGAVILIFLIPNLIILFRQDRVLPIR